MRHPQLKEALVALGGAADLNPACRLLVVLPTDAVQAHARALAIISRDPAAAQWVRGAKPGSSLEQAAGALGLLGTLRAVFLGAYEEWLRRMPLRSLGVDVLLEEARARTEIALRLANVDARAGDAAVLAASAWLDAGKVLIDCAAEDEAPAQFDAPGPAAASLLEAESERHGADHALAGKWVAERWGMPLAVCEAIWLHHHTLSTIGLAAESQETCYFTMLTDALCGQRRSGTGQHVSAWVESLCGRVGLRAKDVLAASRPAEQPEARVESVAAVSEAVADAEARYRALCAMHEALHAAERPGQVLMALATALREGFACPRGTCVAGEEAATWDGGPAVLHARPAEGTVLAGSRQATLPLAHGGREVGQVTLVFAEHDARPMVEVLGEVGRVLDTSAAVIARVREAARAQARGEALATALHGAEAERQRAQESERLSGLARFAAGAAHEINNPLAVISGRAQLLLAQVEAPEQSRALDAIVQQSRRISKIVSDLMQFARPPEPKWTLAAVPPILRQIVAPMRERFEAKNIVLVERYAQGLPRVRVDHHQIEQALMHGIMNAEQALEAEGGRIEIVAAPSSDGAQVEIAITDNGPGIVVEDLGHVFEPFFTRKQFREGCTGLGLTVCRGVVEAHHGTVQITSRAGRGTALLITLPFAEAAAPVMEAPVAEAPSVEEPAAQAAALEVAPEPVVARPEAVRIRELLVSQEPEEYVEMAEEAGEAAADVAPVEAKAEGPSAEEIAAQAEAIVERVFPRMPAPRSAGAPPAIVPALGRILLIEENEDLREILRAGLESRGYATTTAPDGLEGLASALAHPPDLIVCATRLSGVDTVTLVRQVRQRFSTLPVIVIAGPGPDDLAADALQAGARALLHKPFDFDRFLQEVNQFLHARSVA